MTAVMGRARKRFGQHFLQPSWVDRVVRAIDPHADDTFIEVGPGRGALTRALAARARAVFAYEIDRDLVRSLRPEVAANVTIIEGDFLEQTFLWPMSNAEAGRLRLAGNLPYNVASPILFKIIELFDSGIPVVDATVMVQAEVAERLIAKPETKEYGVLTVLVRHSAHVSRLLDLPPGAFRPPPKVRSSLVRLQLHPPDPMPRNRAAFAALVQAVFTQRRKTIHNALKAFAHATNRTLPSWLDARRRPETLSVAEFVRLSDDLAT
jgi:16S rRNA (adenine1518-N6/adenine1519-N6)-dimethyltransferase